ncbi:MAG: hypothetical protein V3U84_06950 [Thiotrichaceae bacterium]
MGYLRLKNYPSVVYLLLVSVLLGATACSVQPEQTTQTANHSIDQSSSRETSREQQQPSTKQQNNPHKAPDVIYKLDMDLS